MAQNKPRKCNGYRLLQLCIIPFLIGTVTWKLGIYRRTQNLLFNGVPVRMYRPEDSGDRVLAGIVFYHGGGWRSGSVDSHDNLTRSISYDVKAVVVSVEYRLAPTYPFPTPFQDCFSAMSYFMENTEKFHVDPHNIAVMGSSAGGNLAAAVALKLRDNKARYQLKSQVLIYPTLQMIDLETPSMQGNEFSEFVSKEHIATCFHHYIFGNRHPEYMTFIKENMHTSAEAKVHFARYLNHEYIADKFSGYKKPDLSKGNSTLWQEIKDVILNPYFAPLMAKDLRELPNTYIFTAQDDVLRDDGILYVHWLRQAGVDVTYRHSQHGHHSMFLTNNDKVVHKELKICYQEIVQYLMTLFRQGMTVS